MLAIKALGIFLLGGFLWGVVPLWGAESQKAINLTARILPRISLSLSHSQLTLVGREDEPVIVSQEGPVEVVARGRTGNNRPLLLTVQTDRDLEGPSGRIPIQQVSWSAQGAGLRSGTLSRGRQLMGSWPKSGEYRGQVDFVLNNDGRLIPGDYGTAVTLTLSSP